MVEIRDAATVMLVRDGKRHRGAHAAPQPQLRLRRRRVRVPRRRRRRARPPRRPRCRCAWDEPTPRRARGSTIDKGGLAYWVAAVRECFEESGCCWRTTRDGAIVRLDDPAVEERFVGHRKAIDNEANDGSIEVCAEENLKLAVDSIHYFGHWITPAARRGATTPGSSWRVRRPAQVALHDDRETIANIWIRPQDALDRAERRRARDHLPDDEEPGRDRSVRFGG